MQFFLCLDYFTWHKFLRFIHVVSVVHSYFIAKWWSVVWICYAHLCMDIWIVSILLANMNNNIVVSICVQVFVWTCFRPFNLDSQEWNCWVVWYVLCLKKLPISFSNCLSQFSPEVISDPVSLCSHKFGLVFDFSYLILDLVCIC